MATDNGGQATLGLDARLRVIAAREGGSMFMGLPDRWWDNPHWRCLNDHVSTRYLGTDQGARCLGCPSRDRSQLWLTFPEDQDGPLPAFPERANYGCVDCGSTNHTTGDVLWCRVEQARRTCVVCGTRDVGAETDSGRYICNDVQACHARARGLGGKPATNPNYPADLI